MADPKNYYDHVLMDAAREGLVRERIQDAASSPGIRTEKVVPAIIEIAEGSFETDRRIDGAVDKILASPEFECVRVQEGVIQHQNHF